jgi:hypothetical protein
MARLFAVGGLASHAAAHLVSMSGISLGETSSWLLPSALAALPGLYVLLGGLFSIALGEVVHRFDFDPAYLAHESRTVA